jgi:hypothetical protein
MLPVESSLMIVVPEAERLVKPFREKHDPSASAGVPAHVTLLYPFEQPAEINEIVLDNLNQCFAHFRPFAFSLRLMEMSQVATVGGTLEAPARSEAAPWVSGCARRFVLSGW